MWHITLGLYDVNANNSEVHILRQILETTTLIDVVFTIK